MENLSCTGAVGIPIKGTKCSQPGNKMFPYWEYQVSSNLVGSEQ